MSGINADISKPHSTRSASSSHARLSGLSLPDILKRGTWCIKTTWEKFYNKSILTFEEKFQKAVVNKEGFEERRMRVFAPLLPWRWENTTGILWIKQWSEDLMLSTHRVVILQDFKEPICYFRSILPMTKNKCVMAGEKCWIVYSIFGLVYV